MILRVISILCLAVLIFGCGDQGSNTSSRSAKKILNKDAKGNITEEGMQTASGEKHGSWITYHTGNRKQLVKSLANYKNGQKDGPYLEINDQSNVKEKSWYQNGKLEGERLVYNRTRIKEQSFYQNGQLEGERKLFYDDGTIQEESSFKNGKRNGSAKWYDQEGNITIEYRYENGEKVEDLSPKK